MASRTRRRVKQSAAQAARVIRRAHQELEDPKGNCQTAMGHIINANMHAGRVIDATRMGGKIREGRAFRTADVLADKLDRSIMDVERLFVRKCMRPKKGK